MTEVKSEPGPNTMRSAPDGVERRSIGLDGAARTMQLDRFERRAGMAGDGLAVKQPPVARARAQRDVIERRGVDVPLRVEQTLANGNRLGKRSAGVFKGREHEVAERMITRDGEAILERPHQRITRILRESRDALRISPGGVTSASSRRTPVEPPSSAMATTALVSTPSERSVPDGHRGAVPPPMTTARRCLPGPMRISIRGILSFIAENDAVADGSIGNAGRATIAQRPPIEPRRSRRYAPRA